MSPRIRQVDSVQGTGVPTWGADLPRGRRHLCRSTPGVRDRDTGSWALSTAKSAARWPTVSRRGLVPEVVGEVQCVWSVRRVDKASAVHDVRRAELLESLVELYLRLNGYFCIRNYLHHLLVGFGLETESDLLAIRMPHQQEVLRDGRRQPNDPTLILPEDQAIVDCVIAEVKEPSVEFNAPIRHSDGSRLIVAALRMFGLLPEDAFKHGGAAHRLADDLHRQITNPTWADIPTSQDTHHNVSVRMLVFAPETAKHVKERKHFDLQHVLDFTNPDFSPRLGSTFFDSPDTPDGSLWPRKDSRRTWCS